MKPTDIESELAKLWEAQTEQNKTKACLFNLVLFSQEPRRTNYFRELIRSTIEKFPCRILFIEGDEKGSGDGLSVQVSNQTVLRENSLIACDQISVKASTNQYVRVPFLIIPHLISDLPLYLLWGQDPMSDQVILPHLISFATRLIFDSECTYNLQDFSQQLLEKKLEMQHIELMDMNWARLSGWRDALATIFKSADRLKHLYSIEKITLTYQSQPTEFFQHTQTQALYLAAWFAAQLHWTFQQLSIRGCQHELQFTAENRRIQVILNPEARPTLDPGSILEVIIESKEGICYKLKRDEEARKVTVYISNPEWCETPLALPLPNLQRGFTLIKELFHNISGEHYWNTFNLLSLIPWPETHLPNGRKAI